MKPLTVHIFLFCQNRFFNQRELLSEYKDKKTQNCGL